MVRALAETMFPGDVEGSGDQAITPERLEAFVDDVDAFISPASKTLRFGLIAILVAIRWSPLLYWKLRPFDELSVGDRVRHLERLERSKVAHLPLLVVAYKTVLTMLFYEDPTEQRAIGYPGPTRRRWLMQTSVPRPASSPRTRAPASTREVSP